MPKRRSLIRELLQFGAVGGVGFVVDAGVFNALYFTVLSPQHFSAGPMYAKVISTAIAIAVNWAGNRWLTFRDRRRSGRREVLREAIEFGLVSIAGSLISLACLGVSHYGLGLTSPVADNVSANILGLALGSAFRFVVYRWWVFGERRAVRAPLGERVPTAG